MYNPNIEQIIFAIDIIRKITPVFLFFLFLLRIKKFKIISQLFWILMAKIQIFYKKKKEKKRKKDLLEGM